MMPRTIDVATQSLANPYGLSTLPPELYVPLWWNSGGSTPTNSGSSTLGTYGLVKGGTTVVGNYNDSQSHMITVPSTWSSSTQCSFEAAIWSSISSYTCSAALYQLGVGLISNSTISTTSTTATVVRSAKFNLAPGQTYVITIASSSTSGTGYITDASLIVFPNQQALAQGNLSNITLGTVGQRLAESQVPLWVYSSGDVSNSYSTVYYVSKGSTSYTSSITSATKLHTLSTSWSSSQKFALEVSMQNVTTGGIAYAELYDTNTSLPVSGSLISTNSNTYNLVRSGTFTLTGGHSYAVAFYTNGTGTVYLTKVHLVPIFGT